MGLTVFALTIAGLLVCFYYKNFVQISNQNFIQMPLGQCAPAETLATDDISSCGSAWMPKDDVTIAQGTDTRRGYAKAVQAFCAAANGKTVKPDGYLSMATEVFLNGGKDPKVNGVLGFVYCR